MSFLFNEILYKPILSLLLFTYSVVPDFGVAIILITILIRVILLPIFYKSAKDQTILQKIAPQIREIQKKHKDDKQQQAEQMMRVYKEHKVNPFSSILLLFIQLPILFALYRVFASGVTKTEGVSHMFLGLVDLSKPNIVLIIITVVAQLAQSWLLLRIAKKPEAAASSENAALQTAERMSRKMMYVMPLITAFILFQLPSAVALYWFTTSVFSAVQQLVINGKLKNTATKPRVLEEQKDKI